MAKARDRGGSLLLAGLLLAAPAAAGAAGRDVSPAPDSAAVVAKRRAGPAIMAARGMTALAPENTLRACVLAMDYGADGVAVDLRRTRDGVLVLFRDASVERLLRGVGRVSEHTLAQLRALRPVTRYGRLLGGPVTTFTELLELARARALLLHLNLREPGLEADVARLLAERNLWPQVVFIAPAHAATLRRDPRFHPLIYQADLSRDRRDLDPAAVSAAVRRPGQLLLVGDPRVAARELKRPLPRPEWARRQWRLRVPRPAPAALPSAGNWRPPQIIERLNGMRPPPGVDRLLSLLTDAERPPPGLAESQRVVLLATRAWLAQELGRRGKNNRATRRALEGVITHPLPVADPELNGVDVAVAIRALGELGATASAKTLVRFFQAAARETPPAKPAADPPASFSDPRWRPRRCLIPALGGLRCRAARRFLEDYVRLSPAEAARRGPPQFEEATHALLQQRLDWAAIARLLRSPNPAVRGAALLECLDHPNEERRLALRRTQPWALELPGARAGPPPAAPSGKQPSSREPTGRGATPRGPRSAGEIGSIGQESPRRGAGR